MAFDFPNTPVVDQVYTQNGVSYVWNGYGWVTGSGGSAGAGDYVLKAGDTMSGPLTLPGDPTQALHSVTKQYVDNLLAAMFPGGTVGQALVKNPANAPAWGAAIESGNY